jgi:hypothetical protein
MTLFCNSLLEEHMHLLLEEQLTDKFKERAQLYCIAELGVAYVGDALRLVKHVPVGQISLIMTLPPFAFAENKPYGDKAASQYVEWFKPFAREFCYYSDSRPM